MPENARKKLPYPEVRPGVKVCAFCKKEFTLPEDANLWQRANWPTRWYCVLKCANAAKASRERARLRARGITRPYKDKPKPQPAFDMTHSHQPRQLDPLKALPPEARSKSVRHAFRMALETHEELLPLLESVKREQRGFKARVKRYIKEQRGQANAGT